MNVKSQDFGSSGIVLVNRRGKGDVLVGFPPGGTLEGGYVLLVCNLALLLLFSHAHTIIAEVLALFACIIERVVGEVGVSFFLV